MIYAYDIEARLNIQGCVFAKIGLERSLRREQTSSLSQLLCLVVCVSVLPVMLPLTSLT